MERMKRLGARLGLAALWVKRDDCTGLGLSGNKVRKLEFDFAAALEDQADCVVCGGVVQSNTARQVAAACAKLGIECHLGIMRGRLASTESGYEDNGNILLDRLYGAILHDIPWDENRNVHLREIADNLRTAGRRIWFPTERPTRSARWGMRSLPKKLFRIVPKSLGSFTEVAVRARKQGCWRDYWR
jgi:L-cysteate sulfo-lyase